MRQLLRSDQPYLWTRACDEELNFLKGSLRSDMVLAPIRYDRPFYLFTHASSYGTGFCLVQKWPSSVDPKREVMRPISFGGHANATKSQQNASGGQVELLAVCQGLRQYENILLGQTIIVVTDSATVTYYQKLKFGKQSQIRMLAYMSQFELSFLFTKGILNHIDFISRLAQNLDDHEKLVLMPEDRSDFIFAIEQRGKSEKSEEFSDQSAGSCGEWKTYTPQFDNVDNVLENECVLQHDLINCINQQDCFGADVTTPTTLQLAA